MAVPLKSPIAAGVLLFPASCFMLPGSAVVSQLITRFGHFRWAIWSGWVIATLGCGLLIFFDQHTSLGVWIAALLVWGLGNGIVLSAINFGIQAIVDTEDTGRAAAMYAFMRTLGMAIGVAIGGTVFQNLMAHRLRDLYLYADIAKIAEGYIDSLEKLETTNPVSAHGVTEAYVHGFQGVYIIMTAISGLGLIATSFIKHHSMDVILVSRYQLDR